MEKLIQIRNTLITQVQEQLEHIECANIQELGAVIDMIKDIEEACYYASKQT